MYLIKLLTHWFNTDVTFKSTEDLLPTTRTSLLIGKLNIQTNTHSGPSDFQSFPICLFVLHGLLVVREPVYIALVC